MKKRKILCEGSWLMGMNTDLQVTSTHNYENRTMTWQPSPVGDDFLSVARHDWAACGQDAIMCWFGNQWFMVLDQQFSKVFSADHQITSGCFACVWALSTVLLPCVWALPTIFIPLEIRVRNFFLNLYLSIHQKLTRTNLLHVTTNNTLDGKVSIFPKTKTREKRGLNFFFQISLVYDFNRRWLNFSASAFNLLLYITWVKVMWRKSALTQIQNRKREEHFISIFQASQVVLVVRNPLSTMET